MRVSQESTTTKCIGKAYFKRKAFSARRFILLSLRAWQVE